MDKIFDKKQAKKFLEERNMREREAREKDRVSTLALVETVLKETFHNQSIEVYLIGSILQPYMFYPHSDVDVVIKNLHSDRFDLWALIERKINRKIEIIIFEKCPFKDHVLKNGYRIL